MGSADMHKAQALFLDLSICLRPFPSCAGGVGGGGALCPKASASKAAAAPAVPDHFLLRVENGDGDAGGTDALQVRQGTEADDGARSLSVADGLHYVHAFLLKEDRNGWSEADKLHQAHTLYM